MRNSDIQPDVMMLAIFVALLIMLELLKKWVM